MALRWSEKIQIMAESGEITGESLRRARIKSERKIVVFELQSILTATGALPSWLTPDQPRWMTFVEGKYIFRIDHIPSADEYLVDVVRRRSRNEKSGADAAAAIARVVARRAKRSNLWTGAGATERAMLALYNLARNSLGASVAGNVTNLSRAFVRYVRDKGSSVGIAAVALSDRCRQAWLGEVASPGQQAVAAALVSFLTPQNVAPVLVSRLRRETVRISEHFRLELLKPISASPFGLWQPDMFGEPQLDIGRLLT